MRLLLRLALFCVLGTLSLGVGRAFAVDLGEPALGVATAPVTIIEYSLARPARTAPHSTPRRCRS